VPNSRPGGRTARVRAQVFDATIDLVARHGVTGVRYEEIAELSGVHKTSIYRNWPTRDVLVRDALTSYAEQMAPLGDTGDLRADLVEFLCRLAEILDSPFGRAIINAVLLGGPEWPAMRDLRREVMHQRLATMRHRFDRAVEAGQLPTVDATLLSEMLSAPVHYRLTTGLAPFTRADAEWVTDVVLSGVWAIAGRAASTG
jgi:AcrR family transcriptional regulator